MALTLSDVQRVANLARIEITPSEADATLHKLAGIFAQIEAMQRIDTRGIEPMAHAQDVALPMRPDVAEECDQRELFQALATETQDGLYLVPKVIE